MSFRTNYVPELDKTVVEASPPDAHNRHYVTSDDGSTPAFEPFIPDEAYTAALGGAVIKCVDIVILDPEEGEVLIATRQHEPMAGRRIFGGRKRAGETDAETAVTNMRREFSYSLDPSKLIDTGRQYDEVWDTREQPASIGRKGQLVTGSHTSSAVYVLPVAKKEIDLTGYNEEFSNLQWSPVDQILDAKPGEYHPSVVDMVRDSLDVFTAPIAPATPDEAIERAANHLNVLKAHKRQHGEALGRLGSAISRAAQREQ